MQLILNELSRIRTLDLSLSQVTYSEFKEWFVISARELKRLRISCVDTTFTDYPHERRSFPPEIISLPVLKELDITDFDSLFALALADRSCGALEALKLRIPHHSPEVPLAGSALLNTLESMANLTTLDIGNHFLPAILFDEILGIHHIVDCRSLRCLRLAGKLSHLNWLLCHMQLSATIQLDLAVFGDSVADHDGFVALGDNLSRIFFPSHHISNESMTPLSHAACFWSQGTSGNSPSIFHIMLSDTLDAVQDCFEHAGSVRADYRFNSWAQVEDDFDEMRVRIPRQPNGRRIVHLRMHDTLAGQSQTARVESICNSFPLHDVRTLFLDRVPTSLPDGLAPSGSTRLLTSFMNYVVPIVSVDRLTLRGWDAAWIGELLISDHGEYSAVDWGSIELPFPALRKLSVVSPLRSTPTKPSVLKLDL